MLFNKLRFSLAPSSTWLGYRDFTPENSVRCRVAPPTYCSIRLLVGRRSLKAEKTGFDSRMECQTKAYCAVRFCLVMLLSSSGPGHLVFAQGTRIRLPPGAPVQKTAHSSKGQDARLSLRRCWVRAHMSRQICACSLRDRALDFGSRGCGFESC